MTTILGIFAIALGLSLVLTPPLKRLGLRFGAVDEPDDRKLHTRPIARCGGVGIFLLFALFISEPPLFQDLCIRPAGSEQPDGIRTPWWVDRLRDRSC